MTESTNQALSEVPSEHERPPLDYRRIEVIDPEIAAIMRGKTTPQKFAMVQQAHSAALKLIAMGIRFRNPEMTADAVNAGVARRLMHGAD